MPIWEMDGPVKLNGNHGGDAWAPGFVNTSPHAICDLRIKTFDDDFYGGAPDILPERGVRVSTFTPGRLPNGKVGVNGEAPLPETSGWNRSNRDEQSDETLITFEPGNCIQPGKGFILHLKFDETLDGNEGIRISPSRTYEGEHEFFGGTVATDPPPLTWADLLKAIGEVLRTVPIGGLIGSTLDPSKPADKAATQMPGAAGVALAGLLKPKYARTPLGRLDRLPIAALAGIPTETLKLLEQLNVKTIGQLHDSPLVSRASFAVQLARGGAMPDLPSLLRKRIS